MSQEEDHDELVAALQDVMLPAGIPVLPGLDLAARYCLPGGADEAIGNWFDVVSLSEGRVGLVVGEAVGTGMAAAAAMGQVRAVLRAGLEHHEDLVSALELADVFARTSGDARGTAVVVAVLDPAASTLQHATAGHPAPVLAREGGDTTVLERGAAGWLGTTNTSTDRGEETDGASRFAVVTTPLSPGDLVMLTCAAPFRVTASVPAVLDDQQVPGDVEATCDRMASALFTRGHEALTLLAAQVRSEPREGFDLDLPVGELAVRSGRERLSAWLDSIDAPPMDALAVVHASAELVANAVEHAHGGAHRTGTEPSSAQTHLHVAGHLDADGTVHVSVADTGSWRESSDDDVARGRGLAMAAGLVDELDIVTGPAGTTATVCHSLCRPVHIDHGQVGATALPVRSVDVTSEEPGVVVLRGDFGHDDVDRVGAELLLASRGGTRQVRVDLAQVTHLTSTAVRMLGDLVADAHVAPVVLHAPTDSAAQRALDIARVPHDAA